MVSVMIKPIQRNVAMMVEIAVVDALTLSSALNVNVLKIFMILLTIPLTSIWAMVSVMRDSINLIVTMMVETVVDFASTLSIALIVNVF